MFPEDVRRGLIAEGICVAHALADFRHMLPIRTRLAGRAQERFLPGNAPLGICNRAVLFAPCRCRKLHMGVADRVGAIADIGDHDEGAGRNRRLDGIGVRH